MPLASQQKNKRVRFSFAIEGLSAREELLLKSIIRLLDCATKHEWIYDPLKADLWIVDREMQVPTEAKHRNPSHLVRTLALLQNSELIVGEQNGQKTEKVVIRFHAKKIEDVLNEAGEWFSVKSGAVSQVGSNTAFRQDSYKLVRWPTRLIQADTSRSKISALMLSKPLTIAEIVRKSGYSTTICEEFLAELMLENFIEIVAVTPTLDTNIKQVNAIAESPMNKPDSIFSRIRSRLSLSILGNK